MQRALYYLVLSQITMLLFAIICFAIRPDAFFDNTALSYYGTQAATIIPYSMGMLLTAYFLYKGARHLHNKKTAFVKKSILGIATLIVAALMTPYSINGFFFWTHLTITFVMMFLVLGASLYILIHIDRRPINILIASFDVLMFTLVILSFGFWDIVHIQALAELLASLLFITLLYNTLRDLEEENL